MEGKMRKPIKCSGSLLLFASMFMAMGPAISPQELKKDGTKYGRYILPELFKKIEYYTGNSYVAHNGELGGSVTMAYHCMTRPKIFDMTHAHPFQEVLCFVGGNPLDITDFGAEVEIQLGAEHELHRINKTSCVSIPPNLPHCPLNIKRVDRPIVFLEISNTPTYPKPSPTPDSKP
jgi:hypothetical protein